MKLIQQCLTWCAVGILATTLFTSCDNDPISDLSVEETQVYITNRDKSVDFKTFKTFAVSDSVIVLSNQGNGTSLSSTDASVLSRIIQNMKNLGYTHVATSDQPDVGVSVQLINNQYLNIVQYPIGGGWGGGYWGGYGGWGLGYPSYYSYQQVQDTYWVLNLLDFKNADSTAKQLKVIWNAQIQGDGLYDTQYTDTMIDKVFEQSGYLKTN